MIPEQSIADASRKLGVPLTADQLQLGLCETCGRKLPKRPLHCAGCGKPMTEDDISIWNDRGKFCSDSACERKALRWTG